MKRFGAISLAFGMMLMAGSALAQEGDLCQALKAAWTAAKADPSSVRDVTLPGAQRCSFSDNDLRCFWDLASPEEAHGTFEAFTAVATACFAPLALSAVHKVLHEVETTSLEPKDDKDPNVAIFYPPAGSLVGISIVTAE